MKVSESWLQEWVKPPLASTAIDKVLTMAGLEVESRHTAKELFTGENLQSPDDTIVDFAITPNRGDWLSVRGLAREIAALTGSAQNQLVITPTQTSIEETFPIALEAKSACPRYVGRVVRNIKPNIESPAWLQEKLRSSGIRSIHPVVDITNYVMLELGQPMHAFDLNKLQRGIRVRFARTGEQIQLLDESEQTLDNETLVIADQKNPVAIAGVMGGIASSVTLTTRDIFLESAYFDPLVVARQRQFYHLNSDSAYRFERGVDPTIQREAMERATQLILELVGGEPGPLSEQLDRDHLPTPTTIFLASHQIAAVLGTSIPDETIENIFTALSFKWKKEDKGWQVQAPSYRFDVNLPEDVIEEIARLYGYDNIPLHELIATLGKNTQAEGNLLFCINQALKDQGMHEVISYSFIEENLQKLFDPLVRPCALVNPISSDMSVMRTNLWPGLIQSLLYNQNRQLKRIRLFETGACFYADEDGSMVQTQRLGGLVTGEAYHEQWGMPARPVDFYDLKGIFENVLSALSYPTNELVFSPDSHPALHPGQAASVYYHDQKLGVIGALHPTLIKAFELSPTYVFELDLKLLGMQSPKRLNEISKFPEIRRDIAIIVKQAIPTRDIQDTIKAIAGDWLKDIFIFDVYHGKGISPGYKSIALALILQHQTRTLVDDEVNALMERVITTLKEQFDVELRS